jgi:hypothetical protein
MGLSLSRRHGLTVGGGTKGISEFVDGLRLAARTIAGGKETSKHKRRRSGLPPLESTLALGYTYVDIIDEENDGISSPGYNTDGRHSRTTDHVFVSQSVKRVDSTVAPDIHPDIVIGNDVRDITRLVNAVAMVTRFTRLDQCCHGLSARVDEDRRQCSGI